jgi:hypothetical protein
MNSESGHIGLPLSALRLAEEEPMRRPFIPIMEGLDHRELQAVMTPLTVSPPNKSVPPFIPGPGLPTALEQARERFTATFSGRFNFGPPRFTGSYAYLFLQGTGTSSQFLHGNYSMGIVLPTQTGAAITGGAYLQDLNLSGGTEVGLDINFDPTSLDGAGRPTRGAWSVDPNIYSGLDFVAQGAGTVTIHYVGKRAITTFQGQMYTNGLTNPLGNE